jgi:inactive phospholipase D5
MCVLILIVMAFLVPSFPPQTSPDLFCPKNRAKDIDVIQHVMQEAKLFIYISVTDYIPLLTRRSGGPLVSR